MNIVGSGHDLLLVLQSVFHFTEVKFFASSSFKDV